MRSLLVRLARMDPSYARRLAPELLALHRLLSELRRGSIGLHLPHSAAPSGGAAISPVFPVTVLEASSLLGTRPVSAAAAHVLMAATSQDAEAPADPAGVPPARAAGARVSKPRSLSPSAAPRPTRLLTNPIMSTGPSRSVSAASGSPAGATGTLVTMCAVCLCLGMLLGRMTLIVLPWRLAVIGHRLERPG